MPEANLYGFEELAEGSRQLFENIGESAERRFEGIAAEVRSAVEVRVPYDSGALAAAYTVEPFEGGVAVGIPDKDEVPYAGWIEFGGIREGGRNSWAERDYIAEGRYLFPIALEAGPVLVAAGSEQAKREIRGYAWKTPRV